MISKSFRFPLRPPLRSWLLLIALLAGSLGCFRAELRPTAPVLSHSGEVETRLQAVRVGYEREFILGLSTPVAQTIRRAFLTVPSRSPCTGGLEPTGVAIDGLPGTGVPAGTHQVGVRFGRDDFAMDLALDLDLDEGHCARTPVFSTVVPMEVTSAPILSVSMPLVANTVVRGLRGFGAVQVGIGKWLGGVRMEAEVGVGAAFCDQTTCGKDDAGQSKSGLAIPLSVQASYRLGQWNGPGASLVPMVGIRYSYIPMSLPTLAGTDSFALHAIHGLLSLGLVEGVKGAVLQHLERAIGLEIVLLAGVAIEDAGKTAFSGGIAARALFPL